MGNSWIIAILVVTECTDVGLNTLAKAATRQGMSEFVFVVYSSATALLFLLPSTFVFHRVRPCPQLTFSIVCRIFLLGLLSCTVQICMFVGIGYGSPTLASVITDLNPAFTFILAIITRMEKLELKVPSSQAKSIGTIISITGALIVTLYKGPSILFSQSAFKLVYEPFLMPQWNWIFGGILCTVGIFFLALLFIVKAWIIKDYPAELMVTLISCFFETLQSAIVALVVERDPSAWKLSPNLELVTIFYSAILAVSFRNVVQAWALRKKGPVFVAMFKPLDMFIAAVMGITFLGDALYIGSVIGAAVIAVGFYAVMWGKAKEEKDVKDHEICSFDDRVPLLQNTSVHVQSSSVIGAAVIAVGFYAVMWGKAKEEKDVKDHEICSFDESSDRVPLLQNTSVHV